MGSTNGLIAPATPQLGLQFLDLDTAVRTRGFEYPELLRQASAPLQPTLSLLQLAYAIASCTPPSSGQIAALAAWRALCEWRGMTRDAAELNRAKLSALPNSTSGTVFAEYLTVLALASLVIAAALVELGSRRARVYFEQRESLYQPYP